MTRPSSFSRSPLPLRALGIPAIAVLAACGGGGGSAADAPSAAGIRVVRESLMVGDVRFAYDQRIRATGGSGSYRFAVSAGSLPAGLTLADDGRITGTPTLDGTSFFTVKATDNDGGASSGPADLVISVGSLPVRVDAPRAGDPWVGDTCTVCAPNETSPVLFEIRANATGASILPGASGNEAAFLAGTTPGTDLVRCTTALGQFIDVPIEVRGDPFANMTARFGTTDVWYVDFDVKLDDASPFATDFDAALARVGLRSPTSEGVVGSPADNLARSVVIHETLRWLNRIFLNADDGTPLPGGLAVSFPYAEPGAPYSTPPLGGVPSEPGLYNAIAVHGRAGLSGFDGWWCQTICPDYGNAYVEHLMPGPAGGSVMSGVYLANLAPGFNAQYANTLLPQAPVCEADVAALESLLYGTSAPVDARSVEVRRVAEDLGRLLAVICAELVAYDVGLDQRDPTLELNGDWTQWPSSSYMPAWQPGPIETLRDLLPGPAR